MSSIIPGYTYDIFISYRQKDNKGDHWVSEFVEALKTELESTFKEEISVYFDINPHDGLLETHDVDASLKEKLKCLIFIPIISRTYCDPKSFAWEHEFKAFVEMASKDQFGLKVKLPNGNVASRVVPVRIHELEKQDIYQCEQIMGGVLRGIEFIYKEAGVDKPLAPGDDENKNLNKTRYRIQLARVAHGVREIIFGLKNESSLIVAENVSSRNETKKTDNVKINKTIRTIPSVKRRILIISCLASLLIITLLAWPLLFKRNVINRMQTSGDTITVGVMPFRNMTNDTSKNIYQYVIQNIIINFLTGNERLNVIQPEAAALLYGEKAYSFNNASEKNPVLSQRLAADIYIDGNIIQAGSEIRLNALVIDAESGKSLRSFRKEGDAILDLADSIARDIRDFLVITGLKNELTIDFQKMASTRSPEAYGYYILGQKAYFSSGDFSSASAWFDKAAKADPGFNNAKVWLVISYAVGGKIDSAKKYLKSLYEDKENLSNQDRIMTCGIYSYIYGTPQEEIKYHLQYLQIDDQSAGHYYDLGRVYTEIGQYENAISALEKGLSLYDKWGVKPIWYGYYYGMFLSYHKLGQHKKEQEIYIRAEKDFPEEHKTTLRNQAICSLSTGDTSSVNSYHNKYFRILKGDPKITATRLCSTKASVYQEAGLYRDAEIYYRKSYSLTPSNPSTIGNLAFFLIESERNVKEGLDLIEKARQRNLDDRQYLFTKGFGLQKLGNYNEALKCFEQCVTLEEVYKYETHRHIEEVKKAIALRKPEG